ncbi:unnamed protein product [Allacma fusca]|uniref:Uncharacterized protein n=1 Tax=Allacma fusca TaxID=39272 RepID=A0A8J2L7P6_9HEXA|nr:unnamed protein product [Allacma fusca]
MVLTNCRSGNTAKSAFPVITFLTSKKSIFSTSPRIPRKYGRPISTLLSLPFEPGDHKTGYLLTCPG